MRDQLGHRSIKMTVDVYGHLAHALLRVRARRIRAAGVQGSAYAGQPC